jgi:hypothetical protein
MSDIRQLELWRHARQMRRGIRRQDLAFVKAEYRACVQADEQWRPIAETISKALLSLHDVRLRTPDHRYLDLVTRDLQRVYDRFDNYRSTYDRRRELLELAFSREYPDAPVGRDRLNSPEWKDKYAQKWSSFVDAWEPRTARPTSTRHSRNAWPKRSSQAPRA